MNEHVTDAMNTRQELLEDAPVTDLTMTLAGVDTSVLVGGAGPPMVLLHGPGEHAATWLPVLDQLADSHRIIVPDLPGHGATGTPDGALTRTWVEGWLESLVDRNCSEPPVLVGRVTGGALAARFVAAHPGTAAHLVLVDTTGLVPFAPDARFGLALGRYLADPSTTTFARAMDFCAFDVDAARSRLGDRWTAYLRLHGGPGAHASGTGCDRFVPRAVCRSSHPLAPAEQIDAPTTLIWGRHDLATPLHVAETASALHGWPLYVIEGAGDDPPLDQPGPFVEAILAAVRIPTGARQ